MCVCVGVSVSEERRPDAIALNGIARATTEQTQPPYTLPSLLNRHLELAMFWRCERLSIHSQPQHAISGRPAVARGRQVNCGFHTTLQDLQSRQHLRQV